MWGLFKISFIRVKIERFLTSIVSLLTYILLPAITYTLTLVISSNIALSLGMVGALSIAGLELQSKMHLI